MIPKSANLAIMFAYISGDASLFETSGDSIAIANIANTLNVLKDITRTNNGKVIKTIGDEIMCTFHAADDAANAASAMQEAVEDINAESDTAVPTMEICIGIHYGPTLLAGNDVFGDAVNVAARVAGQAKAGQIITTKTTADLLEPVMRASTRFIDSASIKGKKDVIQIFEIVWKGEDVTRIATGIRDEIKKGPEAFMELHYQEQNLTLNTDKPMVTLGRGKTCDLWVNEKLASRQHVRIELRRNKFFIIDQSTNGTHVKLANSGQVFLRREEMPVTTNGEISLGKSFADGQTEPVRFILQNV